MMEELDIDAVKEKVYDSVSKIAHKRPVYQEMCSTMYSKILKQEEEALKNTRIVDYKSTIIAVPHRNHLDSPVADDKQKTYCVDSLMNDVVSLNKDSCTVSKIIDMHQKEAQMLKARKQEVHPKNSKKVNFMNMQT